jgi:hypothetical protein
LIARGLGASASASFSGLSAAADRICRTGQRVQLGGYAGGFGCADSLEDRQRLPQPVFGLGGAAGGPAAPAQAGQRVRLVQRTADLAGQVQGLLVS